MTETIFDRAADRLRGRWMKGDLADDDGNVCTVGALLAVGLDAALVWEARQLLWVIVARDYPDRCEGAFIEGTADFNDHPDTTEEDVLLSLKKASVEWSERFGPAG